MTDRITTCLVALANERTLLCAAVLVLFLICLQHSAVAGGVVVWMLDCSQLVPTAIICRLTNAHTPCCGMERHAPLQSVCRLPHPVYSQFVQSLPLSVHCSLAYCCRHSAVRGHSLRQLKRS